MAGFPGLSTAFEDMTCYTIDFIGLSSGNFADRARVTFVLGNYFALLGIDPHQGRLFLPSEGRVEGADPILVLGYNCWQRRLAGDPAVVGKVVRVNAKAFTIAGVVPEHFRGVYSVMDSDAFIPLAMAYACCRWEAQRESWRRRRSRGLLPPCSSMSERGIL